MSVMVRSGIFYKNIKPIRTEWPELPGKNNPVLDMWNKSIFYLCSNTCEPCTFYRVFFMNIILCALQVFNKCCIYLNYLRLHWPLRIANLFAWSIFPDYNLMSPLHSSWSILNKILEVLKNYFNLLYLQNRIC